MTHPQTDPFAAAYYGAMPEAMQSGQDVVDKALAEAEARRFFVAAPEGEIDIRYRPQAREENR
jgi:hypothetical protein